MDISIPYYEDMSRISNSNIGWFLKKGPKYLHDMLTGKAEGDKGPQLARGTMIHEYLLQPEKFSEDYVVFDGQRPSSAQQEKFVDELINSTEIEPNKAILSAYKRSYSIVGKSEETMLSKGQEIASTLKDWIDIKKSGKIPITQWQSNQLMRIAENIQKHKLARELLKNPYNTPDDKLFHEFHINWEYVFVNYYDHKGNRIQIHNHHLIKCKSLLDSCHFDMKNKVCTIMDLKTTTHLYHFEDSMNTYDYLRQLCYYTMAAKWYIMHELNDTDTQDWKFQWYIIGIDTTGSNEIRVFQFTPEQIDSRTDIIRTALQEISWHKETGNWDYYKSYYDGDGAEKLNLC